MGLGQLGVWVFGGRFWPPLAAAIAVGVAGAMLIALYGVSVAHFGLARRDRQRALTRGHAPAPAPADVCPVSAGS